MPASRYPLGPPPAGCPTVDWCVWGSARGEEWEERAGVVCE
jgi:hypothetical protein